MRRRRIQTTALAIVCAVAGLLLASGPGTAAPWHPARTQPVTVEQRLGLQQVPKHSLAAKARRTRLTPVNPYLGMVRDPRDVDWAAWRAHLAVAGRNRAARLAHPTTTGVDQTPSAGSHRGLTSSGHRNRVAGTVEPELAGEQEPAQMIGGNDTSGSAQDLPRFGTGTSRHPSARILGNLATGPTAAPFDPPAEDNGAIPLATDVGLGDTPGRRGTTGKIGDGPHGSAGDDTGDFDFYRITGVKAGQRLVVDVDTPPSADLTQAKLDSVVVLWNTRGTAIALNDDDGETLDSRLTVLVPQNGDYFLSVGAYNSAVPDDPFDSGSGAGVGAEGPYSITFGLDADDMDYYRVDLRPGDVLGASVTGQAHELAFRDPDWHLQENSRQDQSAVYPPASPLPGGGNAVLAHVTDTAGRYTIAVSSGAGSYDLTLQVYRPGMESTGPSSVQAIFLDFDGAQVNTRVWGGTGVRTLSPFRAFLGRWGLAADRENAAIDAIVATVRENLQDDFGGRAAVRVLNSRDNPDAWGRPNVSRVIVGGTSEEAGLATVGISQSVDPGNFDAEESALVLLDDLSAPGGARTTANPSLNVYFAPASHKLTFLGHAIGNAVTHEAGHYLGGWHTAALNDVADLMDQGGNFAQLWGVGKDGVGGTDDDVDVDFGQDVFNPGESFTGTQNAAATIQWGLSPRR